MQTSKNLAQNEYIELRVPFRDKSSVASIVTGPNNAAGAVFVIQIMNPLDPAVAQNKIDNTNATFISIGLWDGVSNANASSLTGSNKYGWADIPGVEVVRVTRTDGTGGVGLVGLSVSHT